jgi:hypothetical protein
MSITKRITILAAIAAAITLAVTMGTELSAEAGAVVVGIVCGVAAGIPTSLLLLVALTRRDQQRVAEQQRAPQSCPRVVIREETQLSVPVRSRTGYWPSLPATDGRQFYRVGDEDLE